MTSSPGRPTRRRTGYCSGHSSAGRTPPKEPSPVPAPGPVPWVNHVRFPAVISAVLLGMFFPLIFRLSRAVYLGTTGFSENVYLTNWLMVTGPFFAASAARLPGAAGSGPPAPPP